MKSNLILLIDDSSEVRFLYEMALKEFQYEVKTVCSRDEAQRVLKEGVVPDLIIVDLTMPGSSLNQFLEYCHSEPNLSSTKIIAVSSFSEKAPAVASLSIPFFQRPSTLEELQFIVTQAFKS